MPPSFERSSIGLCLLLDCAVWRSCPQISSLNFNFSLNYRENAAEIVLTLPLQFLLLLAVLEAKLYGTSWGPEVSLTDEIINPLLRDPTPERLSMGPRSFFSMHRLMADAKIIDSKGN